MKLAAVLVPAFIGWPVMVHAEEAAPVRALLADPAQLASWLRDRDPLMESARDRTEAAQETSAQTHVLPNPQLSAAVGGLVVGSGNSGTPGMIGPTSPGSTTNYSVALGELVEIGKRGPRQAAAALRAREAGELAIGALGSRLNDATGALGKLAYLAAKRDVVAANLGAARTLRDNEKIRLDNKDLSPLEFGRIELDFEEIERALARAESDLTSAVATCGAILVAPCSPAGLDAQALDAGAPLPGALPEPASAIEQRPVRQASRLEASALGEDARLAHNRRIPDPTIGVNYSYDFYQFGGNLPQQFGLSIAIPLPLFDRGDHDAAAAHFNARAVEAEDRAAIREAHGVVDALLAQRATLEAQLQKLDTDAVPRSTQIIAQTRKAFDLGQARLADLLLVERAHRDLLIEVLDTRFDLFTVRAQLRQALGLDDTIARATTGRHP